MFCCGDELGLGEAEAEAVVVVEEDEAEAAGESRFSGERGAALATGAGIDESIALRLRLSKGPKLKRSARRECPSGKKQSATTMPTRCISTYLLELLWSWTIDRCRSSAGSC